MALNEQMKEAIQEDIADESSRKERLAKQIEGLKSTGKFIGETAVESVPGVSEAIAARNVSRDLKEGDYVGAGIETLAGLAGLAPAGGDALAKAIRTFKPKKTVKAYKLFTKGEDGNLYPLFVDADTPIKKGEYIQAVIPDSVFTAPNGKKYVPSKGTGKKKGTGDNIPIPDQATRDLLIEKGFLKAGSKAKSVKAVALRPGWHAGDSPAAPHIGNEYKGKKFRGEDQVWAEVEMPADVDWQSIANKRAELKKDGTPNVKTAHITDELPLGGFYRYKTNPNMQGNWLISGQMKINRVLDADEVKRLNKEAGVKDLPTLKELKAKKMAKGGALMDDYQFAELDMETPQKFAEGGMPKQMEMFEDGGLKDEGGMIDEESGNEVPVGSTREEVRDDIPAQLSEGEFVLPADVVRYHGLDKIMALRDEAKAGLQKMEAMGQMGNSDEATLPDDIPFNMEDIDIEDDGISEYAVGGFIPGTQQIASSMTASPTGVFATPSAFAGPGQFAQSPYTSPYFVQGQQQQQQQPQMPQQPLTSQQLIPTTELRQYINDAGQIISIAFANGKPITPIPPGFKPYSSTDATPAAATAAPAAPPTTTQIQDSGDSDISPEERRRQQEYREEVDSRMKAAESLGYTNKQGTMEALARFVVPGLDTIMGNPKVGTVLPDGSVADGYGNSFDPRTGQKMGGILDAITNLFTPKEIKEQEARLREEYGVSPATQAGLRTVEGDKSIEDLLKSLPTAPELPPTTEAPTKPRTAQDDIIQEAFPVRAEARVTREPVLPGAMERVDAPTVPVTRQVEAEIATINPFGRGVQEYIKDADGTWTQIDGETGSIGRKAPSMIAANLNNLDSPLVERRKELFDVPTDESIALPAPRPDLQQIKEDTTFADETRSAQESVIARQNARAAAEETAQREAIRSAAAERAAEQQRQADIETEKFERKAATDAFNAAKREEETASHQARYESQGYSSSAARAAAVNKTDADNEARQQTGNPNASAVTSSSGSAVRSSDGSVVTSGSSRADSGSDSGGGDSGGKIVCTEMYRQTQLDDWKQAIKIWGTYEKKYLTKYHEIGYHWLFKPYVRCMQNSSMFTQLGAYLAQERTKHLKHIMTKGRAKDSLVGNIWCKIIHPIVYVAGRIKNG